MHSEKLECPATRPPPAFTVLDWAFYQMDSHFITSISKLQKEAGCVSEATNDLCNKSSSLLHGVVSVFAVVVEWLDELRVAPVSLTDQLINLLIQLFDIVVRHFQ